MLLLMLWLWRYDTASGTRVLTFWTIQGPELTIEGELSKGTGAAGNVLCNVAPTTDLVGCLVTS